INETRINRQVLNERDTIRIGKTHFVFTAADDDPLIGQNLKGYHIKRRLGKGGMGAVYLALQGSMERDVALKVLKDDFSSNAEFITRFEEEAKLAGRLNHRNIIGVHDFGRTESLYFFSMEFVEGEDLQNRIARQKVVPPAECIQILKQAASGLEHAHTMGILHQDIKPLNIMLDRSDTVKIADLGLARTMAFDQDEAVKQQKLIGTPQYMAPEVLQRKQPDARSDIYSLGATFYHMATGAPPFVAKTSAEVIRLRLQGEPTAPNIVNSALPQPLNGFILRMMAKAPEARPQSMAQLLAEIEPLLQLIPASTPKAAPRRIGAGRT
ncbi:MAG: serine/threonine-protein kinase, partial [Planctomycetota bacterium]